MKSPGGMGLILIMVLTVSQVITAQEFKQDKLRFVIHRDQGRFSLYYLINPSSGKYIPLIADEDPRSSFLAVKVDGRVYRLGDDPAFRVRIENRENPAIVFESSFLRVYEEFAFIKKSNDIPQDGISITIRIENIASQSSRVEAWVLLDTCLGEQDNAGLTEITIPKESRNRFFLSQDNTAGLAAGIFVEGKNNPSSAKAVDWRTSYHSAWIPGTSGTDYPSRDQAVSYYYGPLDISRGGQKQFTIILYVDDNNSFSMHESSFDSKAGLIHAL